MRTRPCIHGNGHHHLSRRTLQKNETINHADQNCSHCLLDMSIAINLQSRLHDIILAACSVPLCINARSICHYTRNFVRTTAPAIIIT